MANSMTHEINQMVAENEAHKSQDAGSENQSSSSMMDRASELASQAGSTLSGLASQASGSLSGVAAQASQAADRAAGTVGTGLHSAADQLRNYAGGEGYLGTAGGRLADTLESSASYLSERGLGNLSDDLATLIRRNPVSSLLVGVGIGFLLSRATSGRR